MYAAELFICSEYLAEKAVALLTWSEYLTCTETGDAPTNRRAQKGEPRNP